jgi:hypothetical protein
VRQRSKLIWRESSEILSTQAAPLEQQRFATAERLFQHWPHWSL